MGLHREKISEISAQPELAPHQEWAISEASGSKFDIEGTQCTRKPPLFVASELLKRTRRLFYRCPLCPSGVYGPPVCVRQTVQHRSVSTERKRGRQLWPTDSTCRPPQPASPWATRTAWCHRYGASMVEIIDDDYGPYIRRFARKWMGDYEANAQYFEKRETVYFLMVLQK